MNVIDKNMAAIYGLEQNQQYEVKSIDPLLLLSSARLDIAAKIIYLKYSGEKFAEELYKKHIKAVTKYSIVEMGNRSKNGYRAYMDSFEKLNESITAEGYLESCIPIPVNIEGIPLDGAHRIASAIVNKKNVNIVYLPVRNSDIFDYRYFQKYDMAGGFLDMIMQEYIYLKKDIFMVNIWPIASHKKEEIEKRLKLFGDIVYEKEIPITYNGMFNYMHQIYGKDAWVGTIKNDFGGTYRKVEPCFSNESPLCLIVFEKKSEKSILDIKEDLRSFFHMGKHSLHINDTKEEAIEIANILCNENSIHFLNYGNPLKYKRWYKSFLNRKNELKQVCAVTSSSVLALYGIREANDWDIVGNGNAIVDSHNEWISMYGKTLTELLYDSRNYLVYHKVKFLSLDNVYTFKSVRNEGKDQDDLRLIEVFRNECSGNIRMSSLVKKKLIETKRRFISILQGNIIRLAHLTHTYYLLRRIYHFFIKEA